MSFSAGPFITCFIGIAFLTFYLYLILYRSNNHLIYDTKIIFIGITIIFLRMCIPVNFPFTYTIYSTRFLPPITNLVYSDIGQSGYMISDIFFIIWLIIAIFMLSRLFIRMHHLNNYLKAYTVTDEQYPRLAAAIKCCCSEPVRLAIVPLNVSPSISGLLHPTVIFPDSIEKLSDEKLHYLCMHEINHYKNHDLWMKLLIEIVCCINWWNPLVYFMKNEYSLALELVNDFEIVTLSPDFDKKEYSRLLIETVRNTSTNSINSSREAIPFVRKSNLVLQTRVNFILNAPVKRNRKNKHLGLHIIVMTIAMAFSLLIVVDPSSPISPSEAEDSFEADPSNTYLIHTADGYEIYVDDEYITTATELPESFKDYKIYEKE